eukprot:SAG25_NODE_103_length_15482_cov_9.187415_11_plen_385_part_00
MQAARARTLPRPSRCTPPPRMPPLPPPNRRPWTGRLQAVAQHLLGRGRAHQHPQQQHTAAAAVAAATPLPGQGASVGLPLARQDSHTGQLTPQSLTELAQAMATAADQLDFRTAAHLKTMIDVLGPRSRPWSLADFTSADADRAADLVLEHGFCVLPAQLSPPELQRMRDAYERVAPSCRSQFEAEWHGGRTRADLGKHYSFPMFEEDAGDPVAYFPLLDPPLLMQVLHRVLGRPALVSHSGGRVIPSGSPPDADDAAGCESAHPCLLSALLVLPLSAMPCVRGAVPVCRAFVRACVRVCAVWLTRPELAPRHRGWCLLRRLAVSIVSLAQSLRIPLRCSARWRPAHLRPWQPSPTQRVSGVPPDFCLSCTTHSGSASCPELLY